MPAITWLYVRILACGLQRKAFLMMRSEIQTPQQSPIDKACPKNKVFSRTPNRCAVGRSAEHFIFWTGFIYWRLLRRLNLAPHHKKSFALQPARQNPHIEPGDRWHPLPAHLLLG